MGVGESTRTAAEVGAIDCHAHVMPSEYVDKLVDASRKDPSLAPAARRLTEEHPHRFPLALGNIDRRLELMDAAGIETQVLAMGSPFLSSRDDRIRRSLVQTWNDSALDLAAEHPGRFFVFASVPLPDVRGAVAEVERLSGRENVIGWLINTHPAGWPIDDVRLDPLYAAWDATEAIVFVHPSGFCVEGLLDDHGMNWDIGTQFDDTIASVRLYSSGTLERFPGIRWIISHLGGALPFLLGRLDQHWQRDRHQRRLKRSPSRSLDGLFFDTAGHDVASIRFAIERLGAKRIVLGSDFPMVNAADLAPVTDAVRSAAGDDRDAFAVRRGNLTTLLSARKDHLAAVDPS